MSRTQIMMETKKINKLNSTLLGLASATNSGNDGDCFEFLFNKSLGNGKQYNSTNFDLNFLLDGSLNNITNINSSNLIKNEANTYTLDELLDLAAIVPDNTPEETYRLGGSFDLLSEEPQNICTEFLMDTALASPLSASSEESYDLDELLFQDESSTGLQMSANESNLDITTDGSSKTEILETSNTSEEFQTLLQNITGGDSYISNVDEVIDEGNADALLQLAIAESNTDTNQIEYNENDLSALCSLLFQNQGIDAPKQEELSPQSITLEIEEPVSPSSSESGTEFYEGTEDIRFKPYSKTKKKKTPEQRQRKKAQNRTAASRYRMKKKDELKAMTAEADELEGKNKELRGKVEGLRTEIDYLKNLMLDVIKARLAKGTLPANLLSVVSSM